MDDLSRRDFFKQAGAGAPWKLLSQWAWGKLEDTLNIGDKLAAPSAEKAGLRLGRQHEQQGRLDALKRSLQERLNQFQTTSTPADAADDSQPQEPPLSQP